MQRVKRSLYLALVLEDSQTLDISAFLQGKARLDSEVKVFGSSPLSDVREELSQSDIELLLCIPARSWTAISQLKSKTEISSDRLKELTTKGFLLSDSSDCYAVRARRREEQLTSLHWHPDAAYYHFANRRGSTSRRVDLEKLSRNSRSDAEAFVERYGQPPEAFHRPRNIEASVELPITEGTGDLYDVLRRRQTCRAFDSEQPLNQSALANLLQFVFGCHGLAELSNDVLLLHKTSPSGGSLHPIEAYPLILNVEGVRTGLYHYSSENHSLEQLQLLEVEEARELATNISDGQEYASTASVLILMTARFGRNQWKYRQRSRTYAVMLMDAGHLGQTFYLVATDLGLGAFFTAAINEELMESALGLEAAEEGAIAVCGCGTKPHRGSEMGLNFRPFVPRNNK